MLDNLLQGIHCDEFELQQEALFALEQACLDADFAHMLTSPTAMGSSSSGASASTTSLTTASNLQGVLAPLAREFERLLRVPSSEVPLCVARVVSALTEAHRKHCDSSGGRSRRLATKIFSHTGTLGISQQSFFVSFSINHRFDLVHLWVEAGITEALDDIQVMISHRSHPYLDACFF